MSLSILGDGALKKCARCQEEKTFDQFAKYKKARDGHQAYCRKCNTEAAREYAARHSGLPDCDCKTCTKNRLVEAGLRRCARCKEVKPEGDFYASRQAKCGRQGMCIECQLLYSKEVQGRMALRVHDDQCECQPCVTGVKFCTRCKETKSREDFSLKKTSGDGLQQHCQRCQMEMWRLRRYGLSDAAFNSMLTEQGGKCAACSRDFGDDNKPHIDHDHACCDSQKTCGKCVRQLLCKGCNWLLGIIKDDRNTPIGLLDYLNKFDSPGYGSEA